MVWLILLPSVFECARLVESDVKSYEILEYNIFTSYSSMVFSWIC